MYFLKLFFIIFLLDFLCFITRIILKLCTPTHNITIALYFHVKKLKQRKKIAAEIAPSCVNLYLIYLLAVSSSWKGFFFSKKKIDSEAVKKWKKGVMKKKCSIMNLFFGQLIETTQHLAFYLTYLERLLFDFIRQLFA